MTDFQAANRGGRFSSWSPWAGAPENYQLSIAELVANGTLDAELAGTLWAAASEQLSFLTVAMPRNAGKTTLASAILALRHPGVPLHFVLGEPDELERLGREEKGGYIIVGEFSPWSMPSYIWGESVRAVFRTLRHGYALQSSLHAGSVESAVRVITEENGVGDAEASRLKLVVYIEARPTADGSALRRVSEVFELDRIENGKPVGRPLFRWRPDSDQFEKLEEPVQFGKDRPVLNRRREAIAELVRDRRTSTEDVARLVAAFLD